MEPNNSALMTHGESLSDGAKLTGKTLGVSHVILDFSKMFLNKWNILPAAQGSPQEWSRGRMRTIAVRLRGRDDTWFDETDEMSWFALETCEFNSHGCRGVAWIVTFNNRSIWYVFFFLFYRSCFVLPAWIPLQYVNDDGHKNVSSLYYKNCWVR